MSSFTALQRLVVTIAIISSFVTFLDGTVVTVALPAISRELGGGIVTQQWVVDAYLITLSALILLAGSLSDCLWARAGDADRAHRLRNRVDRGGGRPRPARADRRARRRARQGRCSCRARWR